MEKGALGKVLIAEGDEFLSALIKSRLEAADFLVETVNNGSLAMEKIKEWHPDLVILDIILPGKIGFDVMKDVKADSALSGTAFMVLSSLGQKSDIDKAKELGAINYFIKSQVIIDDLVREVEGFLASKS